MSRDYSPSELVTQSIFQFKDFAVFGNIVHYGPRLPYAVPLNIPRDRRDRTAGSPVNWHPSNGASIWSPRRNLGRIPSDGMASGMALNKAHPTESREILVGRLEYTMTDENGKKVPERVKRSIPVGEKTWVHAGDWPQRPAYDDRSAAFVSDEGELTHVWQWSPRPSEWPVSLSGNHAASWGKFNSRGERVEGTGGATAFGDPWSCTTLTPDILRDRDKWCLLSSFVGLYFSHVRPPKTGERRLVDGLLTGEENDYGIYCGDVLILSRESKTYIQNAAIGGDCALLVEMLATKGLLINDQAGTQVPGDLTKPKAPAIRFQACRDFEKSNLNQFQFKLEDFVMANEQDIQFRLPGDPYDEGTPVGGVDNHLKLELTEAFERYRSLVSRIVENSSDHDITIAVPLIYQAQEITLRALDRL